MSRLRITLADWSLHDQAKSLQQPANKVARKKGRRNRRYEEQEQIYFCEWCESQMFRFQLEDGTFEVAKLKSALVASANGSYLHGDAKRRSILWNILKRMGACAGASDLMLFIPVNGKHGLALEMKKRRDQFRSSKEAANAVSADQSAFLTTMRRRGYGTAVGFGWVDAAKKTCEYLGWNPKDRGL